MSKFDFQTPNAAAKGLGSAKSGVKHYVHQLVTAIMLLVFVPWFIYSVLNALGGEYLTARAFIANPLNAGLLLIGFAAALHHMRLGMQVVIEDYIARTSTRMFLVLLSTFACIGAFVALSLSILKIWLG